MTLPAWIDREENGYFIMIPKSIADFRYEGAIQHNCVYTARYDKMVVCRHSVIVFLRKEKDTPFVTIEYDYATFQVVQAFGRYNRMIDPELYRYIEKLGQQFYFEMHTQQ